MWRCASVYAQHSALRGGAARTRVAGAAAAVCGRARVDARSAAERARLLQTHALRTSSALPRPCFESSLFRARSLSTALESSVESIYQRKTPLEHVLLRPGMYIGSVEATRDTMWLLPDATDRDGVVRMKQHVVEYVPALYKIFDEIIVNAVDNKVRDATMRHLDVTIDAGSKANGYRPWISVHNDGKGIPIQFHTHEQVYVPELVLGHLLTGSNFDDSSARLTGGRHGYGAKLTNIFSTEFVVETGDAAAGLRYKQVWRNNMRERGDPEITPLEAGASDFTRVSFAPDLAKFDLERLTPGMVRVLRKRVVDVAGCLSDVDVTLNGDKLPIRGFESYVHAFQHSTTTVASASDAMPSTNDTMPSTDYIYSRVNKRWEIGVLPSDIGFVQVSFVNGMSALRGGTHVTYVADQLCRRIADHIAKKHADLQVTAAHVKPHLALFINCMIENPTFDSQMKEFMSSRPTTFGSTCILSERLSKLVIANAGIVERVVDAAKSKQRAALLKKVSAPRSKTTVNVPKLEDANWAGGPRSRECALILTEGDSAKALAVAGLAVVGRDAFGVFPLRGKFLNVRDATVAQLAKNAEFAHLCTILGLQIDVTYDTPAARQQLRYGKVVIMTDQDHDGSHIKGLLFNLFHTFWPHLLEANDFVCEFITPIIKATPRTKALGDVQSFFSLPEYYAWKQSVGADVLKQYAIKYYKGLGTSTSAEGRAYFADLAKHLVAFHWTGPHDGDALDMVFSKTRASDRKHWLLHTYTPESYLDTSNGSVSYTDFVNNELIQFSHADNARSLPSVVDGLKVSQRKVLFACLKRKLTAEVKVAQLAGYCSEHTAYHHGEASLHATIVNMAQDFVGANNLPLLTPSGQFGTRLQGGKDAASARYIFTLLQKYTRLVFPEDDDALLPRVDDDGFPVEPVHYVPIVPLLLVNGAEGIGTGWSTSIPNFHPIEVIDNLLHVIETVETNADTDVSAIALAPMRPWFKGFRGAIVPTGDQTFVSRGRVDRINSTTLRITELPIGKWVEDYKKVLWDLVSKKAIRSFSEHHTDRDVRFDVTLARHDLAKLVDSDDNSALIKLLKLESSLSTSNMHAFDANGKLRRFDSSDDVLRAFFAVRLALYSKRKAFLDAKQSRDVLKLANRIRFVNDVAHGALRVMLTDRLPKPTLVAMLREHGYASAAAFRNSDISDTSDSADSADSDASDDDFDYLLNTSLLSFTQEHAEKLQREHASKQEKLEQLRSLSPAQVWRLELLQLRDVLMRDKDFHVSSAVRA